MEHLLKIVRTIQKRYPKSHVGGSVVLFLHGVKLNRSIKDLDVCLDSDPIDYSNLTEESWSGNDFDFHTEFKGAKIDIIVDHNQTFKVINYNGNDYNVTDIGIIVHYKKNYAKKGFIKHEKDLLLIGKVFPNTQTLPLGI